MTGVGLIRLLVKERLVATRFELRDFPEPIQVRPPCSASGSAALVVELVLSAKSRVALRRNLAGNYQGQTEQSAPLTSLRAMIAAVSLTTFVELNDVKERLRLDIQKPWFRLHAEVKARPLTTCYGWTGTAFDYLLRFYVEKLNPCARSTAWVAEKSLSLLQVGCRSQSTLKRATRIVKKAKEFYCEYMASSREAKPNPKLVRAAIDLAQLDLVYRIGLLDLRPIESAMANDLCNLLALIRADDFRAKRTCLLNPTFGSASVLVGGADADLFIDGTLIDIKSSQHLEMGRDIFNQLVGYYCLSCIGGVTGCKGKVEAVAVYYARYGILHRVSIGSFVDRHRLPELLKWFEARARREFA